MGRALSDCDLLLVPSCTEAFSGYWQVRIGAMAHALESPCVSVKASLVRTAPWSEGVDKSTGTGGVFCPPDIGFPPTGVLAEGQLGLRGWTYADVDLESIAHVRKDGLVLGREHWPEQFGRDIEAGKVNLR